MHKVGEHAASLFSRDHHPSLRLHKVRTASQLLPPVVKITDRNTLHRIIPKPLTVAAALSPPTPAPPPVPIPQESAPTAATRAPRTTAPSHPPGPVPTPRPAPAAPAAAHSRAHTPPAETAA